MTSRIKGICCSVVLSVESGEITHGDLHTLVIIPWLSVHLGTQIQTQIKTTLPTLVTPPPISYRMAKGKCGDRPPRGETQFKTLRWSRHSIGVIKADSEFLIRVLCPLTSTFHISRPSLCNTLQFLALIVSSCLRYQKQNQEELSINAFSTFYIWTKVNIINHVSN